MNQNQNDIARKILEADTLYCSICKRYFHNLLLHIKKHKIYREDYSKEFNYSGPWVKHSIESKQRIGIKLKGRKLSEKTINLLKNKKPSSKALEKLKLYNLNKIVSKETREKMSERKKGKKLSQEHKRKISVALKGKPKPPFSIKHRENLSESHRTLNHPKFKYKTGTYHCINSNRDYFYRSSWELFVMKYLDAHQGVEHWEYEPFRLKYLDDSQSPTIIFQIFMLNLFVV